MVSPFAQPFAIHEWRRCRECRQRVKVTLLNGASCPRDPYFTCNDCLHRTTPASDALLERERRPQLRLVERGDGEGSQGTRKERR